MKTEYKLISVGIAIALVGFLPEIFFAVRALRGHLLLAGFAIAFVGISLLLRSSSEFDLA
ncbi:hypothetical protein [Natronorubrum texcoconense]|uniref:Uncharacterized protein n=1 Tax=Natronorubrum texcoconense TaxID=1095776 RepID=A0A1G8ZWB2_9EURY|nr:hypothetical protein [Natronorubrum texcoconense]SDK18924.1 hypothetical protein SAMN04515672_2470 [Natronorubrum texcoconense]